MFLDALIPYSSGGAADKARLALEGWLPSATGSGLFRINAATLALDLGVHKSALAEVFLAGVLEGFFDLRWEFHCPHCQGIAAFQHHLKTSRGQDTCAACNLDFRNSLDANVEITFSATAKVPGAPVESEAELLAAFHKTLGDGTWVKPADVVTGLDLFHIGLFRERFSDDVLSVEESLEIRNVVLLFTDIKGSTSLYDTLGDAKAYNLVREHFKLLFADIEAYGGVVVKTIGDAVMASFRRPGEALQAALAVHDRIATLRIPGTEMPLVVKLGLHSGPAIAVTMNGRFDYFGQAVNKAARIQGLAANQEVYFSEKIFQEREVRRLLAARKAAVTRYRTELKGISDLQTVYCVR